MADRRARDGSSASDVFVSSSNLRGGDASMADGRARDGSNAFNEFVSSSNFCGIEVELLVHVDAQTRGGGIWVFAAFNASGNVSECLLDDLFGDVLRSPIAGWLFFLIVLVKTTQVLV